MPLGCLRYLEATQEAAGNWAQNLWLDGRPYWGGVQMDETAFPILLLDLLRREAAKGLGKLERWWPMVRKAASFIMRNGPVTQQDRWEEDGGYSPFTLAAEISALLAAADIAELTGHTDAASTLRDMADAWNDNIERWVYATGGDLAQQIGVEGYYVRIAPPITDAAASPTQGFVPIKNRPPGQGMERAFRIVSPDSLALVRFGLRAPDDPRILNTVRVIDALLRVQLPQGPCWYRYNGDGYGEHQDGSAFDGSGIGRPWPLLAGERAHYELAAGRRGEAEALLTVMENCTVGHSRLLPEQVWDAERYPRAWNCSAANPPARPVRWSGPIPSTSSFAAPCATARFSTSLRKPCNVIWWRNPPGKSSAGDLITKPAPSRATKSLRIVLLSPAHGALEHRRMEEFAGHQCPRHWPGHIHPGSAHGFAARG